MILSLLLENALSYFGVLIQNKKNSKARISGWSLAERSEDAFLLCYVLPLSMMTMATAHTLEGVWIGVCYLNIKIPLTTNIIFSFQRSSTKYYVHFNEFVAFIEILLCTWTELRCIMVITGAAIHSLRAHI